MIANGAPKSKSLEMRVQQDKSYIYRGVPVLLVHVVGVGAGLVTQPHAVVGDLGRGLVEQFSLTQDLTTGSLSLVDFLHEVPVLVTGEELDFGISRKIMTSKDVAQPERNSSAQIPKSAH